MINPPPKFPPFIFLLSDHSTIELACDVAKKLETLDPQLVSWDFFEPVHEAVSAFIEVDFGSDLGDPREHPHGDHVKDLATWAENHFGDDYFAARAFEEAKAKREFGDDATIVFRDATWKSIEPFIKEFKPHEYLIVRMNFSVGGGSTEVQPRVVQVVAPTVESVVAAIVEATR